MLKDINDIRRANANRLLRERFGGVVKVLADELDIAPGFVSRVLNSQSANARNIGDTLARRIEQVSGCETNWLDHDHDRVQADEAAIDSIEEIDRLMKLATPRTQGSLRQIAEAASAGRLTDADCELLASIAARLAR